MRLDATQRRGKKRKEEEHGIYGDSKEMMIRLDD
jgi:hypothetical protein